jgi:hypothetical protein
MPEINPNSNDYVLSRIETTLNNHVSESQSFRCGMQVKLDQYNERITRLEEQGWKATGAAGVAGAVAGASMAFIAKIWK